MWYFHHVEFFAINLYFNFSSIYVNSYAGKDFFVLFDDDEEDGDVIADEEKYWFSPKETKVNTSFILNCQWMSYALCYWRHMLIMFLLKWNTMCEKLFLKMGLEDI